MTIPFERVEDEHSRNNFDQLGLRLAPILDGFRSGFGSPEGVVAAEPGTVYENKSGGAGVSLYIKESGSGNTGWAVVGTGGGGSEATTVSDTATLDLVLTGTTVSGNVLDSPSLGGAAGSFYLDRANHTGTQPAASISDFSEATDDRVAALIIGGLNLTSTYDDSLGTLTLDVDSTVSTHNFLSAQHGDTEAATATRGDLVVAQGASDAWADGTDAGDLWGDGTTGDKWGPTTAWKRLAIGTTGQVLTVSAGGDAVWAAAAGGGGFTQEQIEDFLGADFVDTATVDVVYTDGTPSFAWNVLDSPLLGGQNSAYHLARANHTGTQLAATISDFTEAAQDAVLAVGVGLDSATLDVAYNDAANTWTANVLDSPLLQGQNSAYHLARANHTGTQLSTTVSDFNEAAQDAVGTILADTATLDFTYTDATPSITAAVLDSPLLGGQNSAYHLARANHTGTQTAATVSDFSSAADARIAAAVGVSVQAFDTDLSEMAALANVRGDLLYTNSGPNWARLAVGTTGQYLGTDGTDVSWRAQSTLDHGSIGGLSDDDHAQYVLGGTGATVGRAGGQTIVGGTAASDKLTFKPTSGGSPTGDLEFDLSAAISTAQTANLLFPTTLTWQQAGFSIADGQTIAVNTGGGMIGFNVLGTWNVTGAPAQNLFFTFRFAPTVNFSSQASPLTDINTPKIFAHSPAYNLPQDTARALLNMAAAEGSGGYQAFVDLAVWAADGIGSSGTISTYQSFQSLLTIGGSTAGAFGWTFSNLYGFRMRVPVGAGIITTAVGFQVDDLATFAGTLTNTPIAWRSLGTTGQMNHAGPAKFGATGSPNTVSGVDVAGDFSTRSFGVVLANGANNDVAIGNHSNIRITGPTGAFNITSLDTPYDGKIVRLINTTAFAMTITNAAATGTAANRIVTSTNADLVGTAGNQTSVTLQYDSTTARWRETGWRP